ncbi:MAG TPA: S8 family serine peptidase [Gaiellaceae bacterium]|nr:S8 family serine peptidase [Gaiellaceae bacterium]
MKVLPALAASAAAAVLLALPAQGGEGTSRYIVVLRPGADPQAVASEHARRLGLEVGHVYRAALRGYSAVVPDGRVAELRADPAVALLSPDGEVRALAQTLPTGVDRIEADQSSARSGDGAGAKGAAVAVIDTGIDPGHPDLNVAGGVNCSTGRSYADGNGHGTHVAGTIGARDDGAGVVGVAPGAPLYAVRVLNNAGSGTFADVICGVDWVTANATRLGIKVANMSLGGSGSDGSCGSDALHLAICNSVAAGITYVVAAGNSAADFAGFVPAAYDQVLTVTAMADFDGRPGGAAAPTCRTDVDDTAADFSNFTTAGSADAGHTIAGPGVCILSTWRKGGYATLSGTSMATPHVAGTASLCLAGPCAGLTPSQVMAKLRDDAAAQPDGYGFLGDPNDPLSTGGRTPTTLYYGHLAHAGGY